MNYKLEKPTQFGTQDTTHRQMIHAHDFEAAGFNRRSGGNRSAREETLGLTLFVDGTSKRGVHGDR
jgi:hypothetical protein